MKKKESIIHVRVPNEIKLEVQYISAYYGLTESAVVRMLIKNEYERVKNIVNKG